MGDALKSVTDATFDTDVLGSDKPVLVDFWAEWCAPCRLVAPVLDEIAREHGDKLTVLKLNIDDNPQVTQRYRVMHVPTLSLFRGGELVTTILGSKSKAALLELLQPHL